MNPAERHARVMSIFDHACELEGAQREAYLSEACSGDQDLRAQVEMMLRHDASANERFDAVEGGRAIEVMAGDLLDDRDHEDVPDQIGGYRVLREIDRGGMGVIYEAQQQSPSRRVALKILQGGLVNRELLLRFDRETHVLGRLQHPGVAQIYEAGVVDTPTGRRPFFAMEYIDGKPLNLHSSGDGLDLYQRLELMARVCDAVEFAHQKGVIHRDLKPSNVLVVGPSTSTGTGSRPLIDAIGQPKVLDFGIARVLDPDLQTATIQTEAGQIIGTLAYMSPEQVAGNADEIDTRCDVYALGAMMYELLTGEPAQRVRGLPMAEAARVIRDESPRPIAGHDRRLGGDVATIVTKAMDKDPARRYGTAGELAADIRRFLSDKPIEARPPSVFYQLRKFARRNKGLVSGIAAAFLALAAGLMATSLALVEARHQRDTAKAASEDLKATVEFQAETLSSLDTEGLGISIVQGMREQIDDATGGDGPRRDEANEALDRVLGFLDPTAIAADALETNVLEKASETAAVRFAARPEVHARVLAALGSAYNAIGDGEANLRSYTRSYELRRASLGPNHLDTFESRIGMLVALIDLGRRDQARALAQELLDACGAQIDPDSRLAEYVYSGMAILCRDDGDFGQAERYFRESARVSEALGDDEKLIGTRVALASVYKSEGQDEEYREGIETAYALAKQRLGEEHDETLTAATHLARILSAQGEHERAIELAEHAVGVLRRRHGEAGIRTLTAKARLSECYWEDGRHDEAIEIRKELASGYERIYGSDHPTTHQALNNLAALYYRSEQYERASEMMMDAMRASDRVLGPDHRSSLVGRFNVGVILLRLGKHEEVCGVLEPALGWYARVMGDDDPMTTRTRHVLGYALQRTARAAEGEILATRALETWRAAKPSNAYEHGLTALLLGECRLDAGRPGEAVGPLREALGLLGGLDFVVWEGYATRSALGDALVASGQDGEADLIEGASGLGEHAAAIPAYESWRVSAAYERVILLLDRAGRDEEAAHWRRELGEILAQ